MQFAIMACHHITLFSCCNRNVIDAIQNYNPTSIGSFSYVSIVIMIRGIALISNIYSLGDREIQPSRVHADVDVAADHAWAV